MRNISRTALAAAALAAGLLAAPPAHAEPSAVLSGQSDVNGDGYGDLVTGSEATVSGAKHAGAIVVNTGSANGISSGRNQIVSQNSPGVPGASEANDRFGSALATGDLNNDGYTDVVAGTPREKVGSDVDGGTVAVLWGSSSGLSSGTTLSDPAPTAHDLFGNRLAVGDFDGDGHDDLLLGSPDGNAATAYPGGAEGLRASVRRTLTQDTPGVPGVTESTDFFGKGVAAGDVNGDGYDDVAVGAEYETIGSVPNAGAVVVLRGSADGLTGVGAQAVHQGIKGVPGVNEPYDRFGSDLRLTDTNGDGNADLAVGAPMENTGNGALWSLRGSADGVTSAHAVSFSAATVGLPEDPYQYFGRSMPTSAYGS